MPAPRICPRLLVFLLSCGLLLSAADSSSAQLRRRLARSIELPQNLQVEAFSGQPFGVARVTVPLPAGTPGEIIDTNGFGLDEANGRALYPAFSPGRMGALLREFLNGEPMGMSSVTVVFLFTGDEPLDVTVYTPQPQQMHIVPQEQPRQHERLLNQWWREYNRLVQGQQEEGDYPPLVETYLTTMLGARLGLAPPVFARPEEPSVEEPLRSLELLSGAERLRWQVLRDTVTGQADRGSAELPLPDPLPWASLGVPAVEDGVEIESLAQHVPVECFYIRFGSFPNYLWLNHLMQEHGGDLSRLITLRGHDAHLNEKAQTQLVLRESALAEVFGAQVIADAAIIGRDTYMGEGAAVGMLFQARNGPLLANDLNNQRRAAMRRERDNGIREEKLTIADHEVSFLSTPDNRIRSFYAVDGDYHLVTTSRAIVERFYQAGAGEDSLGDSAEFHFARAQMPVDREDTVFLYFSSRFFQELVSPQYRIELRRRLRAVTDIELVMLARLAAQSEGLPHETTADLVTGGFLPAGFDSRPDRSSLEEVDGQWVDSLRGARGTFLPIPDVTIEGITPAEAAEWNSLQQYQASTWHQMDPLLVALKRTALDSHGLERLVIDARVAPLNEEKYGWLMSMLGPPLKTHVAPHENDVVSINAVIQGGTKHPEIDIHHIFVGIQDDLPAGDLGQGGLLRTLQLLTTTPGYLGAWPRAGWLDAIGFLETEPDPFGYSQFPLGLWRWQGGGYSVLSFQRPILERVTPTLRVVEAERPAQIRIHVGDLAASDVRGLVDQLSYERAEKASVGNARLLHAISQQLRVPRDEADEVATELLNVDLVCALGGEYELAASDGGMPLWRSDGWQAGPSSHIDYGAPLLEWFRGAEVELIKDGGQLRLHAQVDMQRAESEDEGFSLPGLDQFFGGGRQPAEPEQATPAEDAPSVEELPVPEGASP